MIDLHGKKVLVTGGAGFLGMHIVQGLISRGVSASDIYAPHSRECDLRDFAQCEKAVAGREIVIHAAALTGNADLHRNHPADVFYANAAMGINILEAARRAKVQKIAVIGSVTEYPDAAESPLHEEDLWSGFPEATHAAYSIAKRALLVYGQAIRTQDKISVIHLLMTSMYGPGARPDSGPIPSFIERVTEAKTSGAVTVTAWGTGKPLRDLLYVEDAAEAVLLALEKYDDPMPVNIGSGKETSIADLAKIIAKIMDYDGEFVFDTTKPDGRMRRSLDVLRAEKEFGFKAMTTLEEGLKKTIEEYRK